MTHVKKIFLKIQRKAHTKLNKSNHEFFPLIRISKTQATETDWRTTKNLRRNKKPRWNMKLRLDSKEEQHTFLFTTRDSTPNYTRFLHIETFFEKSVAHASRVQSAADDILASQPKYTVPRWWGFYTLRRWWLIAARKPPCTCFGVRLIRAVTEQRSYWLGQVIGSTSSWVTQPASWKWRICYTLRGRKTKRDRVGERES